MFLIWLIGLLLYINAIVVSRKLRKKVYTDRYYDKYTIGEQIKYSLLLWIAIFIVGLVPILNLAAAIATFIIIFITIGENDYIYDKPGRLVRFIIYLSKNKR